MEKNMEINFKYLKERVLDTLNVSDLEYIKYELNKIKESTVFTGVGGSSVVSEFGSKIIRIKNEIISINSEPRNFVYNRFRGFKNVISCSYGGNNYGVNLAFNNNLKHYLFSNNRLEDSSITYLKYATTLDIERSFISLGATLVPISVLLDYYLDDNKHLIKNLIQEYDYNFDVGANAYEIFSGIDTSTTSKYLESTLVEAGIGIPIVHDKYSYCHGRSTISINSDNIAIYLYRGTELDKLLIEILKPYYKDIIVLSSSFKDDILSDYQLLVQAMYLTKYIAIKKNKDLSDVEYAKVVKKIYKYRGDL